LYLVLPMFPNCKTGNTRIVRSIVTVYERIILKCTTDFSPVHLSGSTHVTVILLIIKAVAWNEA